MIIQLTPTPILADDESSGLLGLRLIACDHCGIVAVDTPRFGWKRWTEYVERTTTGPKVDVVNGLPEIHFDEIVERQFTDTRLHHHCPEAVQYNEWVATGLVHMIAPEEAQVYEEWDE